MAPTRPDEKTKRAAEAAAVDPKIVLQLAATKLEEGDLEAAHETAQKVLELTGPGGELELAVTNLLGHIYVEAGDVDSARSCFLRAVGLDEDGSIDERAGGGPEKFLWLAQLSENGGQESVSWFERGAVSLRGQIQILTDVGEGARTPEQEAQLEERKRKLAGTLCGVAEVYMTDLSWEADAEQKCEALVTEATMVAPRLAETWQTVANVRISQQKMDEAREALRRSLEIWKGLPSEHPDVPDFPTRISLTRLLMEVEMEKEAMGVLDQLIGDDDESVEAWYLGGWCQFILGEKRKTAGVDGQKTAGNKDKKNVSGGGGDDDEDEDEDEEDDDWRTTWRGAQSWLTQCLTLYKAQEYEDERLGEHAQELLASIDKEIGPLPAEGEENGDEDEDMAG